MLAAGISRNGFGNERPSARNEQATRLVAQEPEKAGGWKGMLNWTRIEGLVQKVDAFMLQKTGGKIGLIDPRTLSFVTGRKIVRQRGTEAVATPIEPAEAVIAEVPTDKRVSDVEAPTVSPQVLESQLFQRSQELVTQRVKMAGPLQKLISEYRSNLQHVPVGEQKQYFQAFFTSFDSILQMLAEGLPTGDAKLTQLRQNLEALNTADMQPSADDSADIKVVKSCMRDLKNILPSIMNIVNTQLALNQEIASSPVARAVETRITSEQQHRDRIDVVARRLKPPYPGTTGFVVEIRDPFGKTARGSPVPTYDYMAGQRYYTKVSALQDLQSRGIDIDNLPHGYSITIER